MTIKSRLLLVLAALLTAFAVSLWLLQRQEAAERDRFIEGEHDKSGRVIQRWLEFTGRPFKNFTEDYSQWSEMLDFAKKPVADAAWAKINIDASLAKFDVTDAWVLRTDGSVHYAAPPDRGAALAFPLPAAEIREVMRADHFPHFFADTPDGLVELRGAPIQPSEDIKRETEPAAWFFTARRWDRAELAALGRLLDCQVEVLPPTALSSAGPDDMRQMIHRQPLNDAFGQRLHILKIQCPLPEFLPKLNGDAFELKIFLGFGLLVFGVLAFGLQRWVLRPLGWIGESLRRNDPAAVRPLLSGRSEFAAVARSIETSCAQKAELVKEVGERRQVEQTLRQREDDLRTALGERVRLGRDLHDGIIQSLYAAGLGLAVVRDELQHNPAEADRRIGQVREALNSTVLDLRAFITGLEPEPVQPESFSATVAQLVELLRGSAPVRTELVVDEAVAERMGLVMRANALLIVREGLSNALRHGHAPGVRVKLQSSEGGGARLEVSDTGTGFDPAARSDPGRGLANMRARATACGAIFNFTSAPEQGTCLTVEFPPPPPDNQDLI